MRWWIMGRILIFRQTSMFYLGRNSIGETLAAYILVLEESSRNDIHWHWIEHCFDIDGYIVCWTLFLAVCYTDTLRNTPVILDVGMFSFLLDLTTRCGVSVKDNCISFVITYVRDISHKVEIRTRCTPARAIWWDLEPFWGVDGQLTPLFCFSLWR